MAQLQAKGVQGQIVVDGDWLTISRKGVMAKMTQGLKGDKRIPIANITSVQFKKAGVTSGYIQFSLHGSAEAKGGVFQASQDENSVQFTKKNQPDFEAI